MLGSDARTKENAEPGAQTIGETSRSDSILLLRVGGGANAQLSILRDTVVDIPGHGRNKINAAYAFGGPSLAIETVEQYLGIPINHLVEVNFENFPDLIDSLGGITYTGNRVISRINGGSRNGGYTLRLKAGTNELNGEQALALARTRKNDSRPQEDDQSRAIRQQKIINAIKDKVISFETFVRLPWVAWAAPKAIRSDMSGPTLLGLIGAELIGGSAQKYVLEPSGGETLPDGGAGLIVDDATKQQAVEKFLEGLKRPRGNVPQGHPPKGIAPWAICQRPVRRFTSGRRRLRARAGRGSRRRPLGACARWRRSCRRGSRRRARRTRRPRCPVPTGPTTSSGSIVPLIVALAHRACLRAGRRVGDGGLFAQKHTVMPPLSRGRRSGCAPASRRS